MTDLTLRDLPAHELSFSAAAAAPMAARPSAPSAIRRRSRMQSVAVIGAGITGVTTAYALLNRGFNVTVFDQNRYAAMETSFANGGQLSASNAEVWNRWGTVLKGLKWMLSRDAPLLMNPWPSRRKYTWIAEFLAAIPAYEKNTIATVRMAIEARRHLKAYAAAEGFDFDCEDRGILHIFTDEKEFAHARRVNALLAKGGLERHAVSADEARRIEPALKGALCGGCYTPSDFSGDVHRFATGLSAACARRGVAMTYGASVDAVQTRDGGVDVTWRRGDDGAQTQRFDAIVVCAGVASPGFARQLGDRLTLYPVKGYSVTVALQDDQSRQAAPRVSLLDDAAKLVLSRLGPDRMRIAGTAELNGYGLDIRHDRIRPIVKWSERHFPDVATEHVIPWAGLRPMTPTMVPRVGPGRRPGVYYNTGHGHLGWTLSAATAESVAEQLLAPADA